MALYHPGKIRKVNIDKISYLGSTELPEKPVKTYSKLSKRLPVPRAITLQVELDRLFVKPMNPGKIKARILMSRCLKKQRTTEHHVKWNNA